MPVTHGFDPTGKQLTIYISDAFIFDTHTEFREAYKNVVPTSSMTVTVDLRGTNFMDSSALGMLLLLDEHFPAQRIKIIHCSEQIKQTLSIANFGRRFDIS